MLNNSVLKDIEEIVKETQEKVLPPEIKEIIKKSRGEANK